MEYSKRLRTEAAKYGIPVQSLILAYLLACGFTDNEAYEVAYYSNSSFSKAQNVSLRQNIVDNPNFMEIVKELKKKIGGSVSNNIIGLNGGISKQLTKDDIAEILQRQILALPDGDKAKTDAAVKYAELYAMKKEEIKDDNDEKIIHVYLPLPDNEFALVVENKARELMKQWVKEGKDK